MLRYDEIIAI